MFKRIRFYFALLIAFVKKGKKRLFIGFFVLGFLLVSAQVFLPFASPKIANFYSDRQKPTFIEGVVGKPVYPNPLFDSTETQKDISSLIFRSLFKLDKEGKLRPDLAEKMEQKNDLEYTVFLKKNIRWQDGVKFDAEDVLYTIEMARREKSELADNFKEVSIDKVDDFTINFKLKEAFSPFPFATTIRIIPKHISLSSFRPIGTGAFSVKKVDGSSILLVDSRINLLFKFYKTIEEAKTALKLGEIHSIGGLSPQETEDIARFGSANIFLNTFLDRQGIVYFNTRTGPLKQKEVRQGLSFGVDKEEVKKIAGGKLAALSTGPFALKTVVPQPKERYGFSRENAEKAFASAGYKMENGILTKDGEKLSIEIVSTDDPELNSIVNVLKESWLNLGVVVKSRQIGLPTLRNSVLPNHNFEVLVNFQEMAPDPDQYVLWHTTQVQSTNITGISKPSLDKLLEDARKTTDTTQRVEKYNTFAALLLDEAPAIFLYYPQYSWFVSKKVSGVNLKNFGFTKDRFDSIDSWKLKNKLLGVI